MATTFQFAPSGTSWMTKMKFLTLCVCFLALQLLIFGGHGTGGWLTRYDIYHSDCVVLDRGLCAFSKLIIFLTLFIVQSPHCCSPTPLNLSYYFTPWHWHIFAATAHWKKMPVSNEPPPPRAYHTMTRIGSRFLLIGGYDGKSTFSDMWWLVSEGLFSLFSSAFGIVTWNFESSSYNSLPWDWVIHRLELKPIVHFLEPCVIFLCWTYNHNCAGHWQRTQLPNGRFCPQPTVSKMPVLQELGHPQASHLQEIVRYNSAFTFTNIDKGWNLTHALGSCALIWRYLLLVDIDQNYFLRFL